ncbi:MAG: glycosyltransferase [Tannerellaceae bacterium]|nr:glycosyltransferase [Tannerellaceae bacterium]
MGNDKKVLIISNACFADSDSNGRTLAKLFHGFQKENLAQFYVYGSPNYDVCNNYYRVTDHDALSSFIKRREFGTILTGDLSEQVNSNGTSNMATPKKARKTPLSMLLREVVWKFGRWNGKKLQDWIEWFRPDVIFVSMADNCFVLRFAIQIAALRNIPIVVYSTESYCFKNFNYLTKRPSFFYSIFHVLLKREYREIEKYTVHGIFNTPLLKEKYENTFQYPCDVVFPSSDMDFIPNFDSCNKMKVSYLGNLGLARHKALIELAYALERVSPGLTLDIYGKVPDDKVGTELEQCSVVSYKGFVGYSDVVRIIHGSNLVVHVEYDDEFFNEDLRYAFSTKIADSVCSGTPLFIYARKDLAETDFLLKNKCAFVANTKEQLESELKKALYDVEARKSVVENSGNIREKYFLSNENFKKIIEGRSTGLENITS